MTTKADVLAARAALDRVAEAYLMEQPGWRVRVGPFGDVWAHCNAPNEWLYRLKACEVAMALDESRSPPMTADDARARLPTVTLHPARVWTCLRCGRDNWRHVDVYEVNSRCERLPERVLCLTCGEVFSVDNSERSER